MNNSVCKKGPKLNNITLVVQHTNCCVKQQFGIKIRRGSIYRNKV